MKTYDLNEIKASADCLDVARNLLLLDVSDDGRCAASWRGGDNETTVHIVKDGYFDHKEKDGGSVVDLVAKVKNCTFWEAKNLLGEYLKLEVKGNMPERAKPKVVAEYIYKELDGKTPRHKTVRLEPKDFRQEHYKDGNWVRGLDSIELLPYNLKSINEADTIIINEGEKAAEACMGLGLPGTTFALGTGAWKPEYLKWFRDKNVVIVADNDDPGKQGAEAVLYNMKDVVKAAKILTVSDRPKGDFFEFVEDGGTKEAFARLVKAAKAIDLKKLEKPAGTVVNERIAQAKRLNQTGFKNYELTVFPGEDKPKAIGKTIQSMIVELHDRLLGFPRVLGGELFDFDLETRQITHLHNVDRLFAWIQQKTKHPCVFNKGNGMVSRGEFYEGLLMSGIKYDSISATLEYPQSEATFYATPPEEPPPHPQHDYLNGLAAFFCPAQLVDNVLLKTLFASAVYSRVGVNRPVWIIDSEQGKDKASSDTGRGIGKSSVAELSALLIGGDDPGSGEVMSIQRDMLKNEQTIQTVIKRFLSASGRRKKIALIDNISHYFDSEVFSEWATSGSYSGMAPYGHGEVTRRNNITFVITCNAGTFSDDILRRSQIIYLKRPPESSREWDIEVRRYINAHRHRIIADILDILTNGAPYPDLYTPKTTFKTWEMDVLWKMCQSNAVLYESVLDEQKKRRSEANGEHDEGDELEDGIRDALTSAGFWPETRNIWIKGSILKELCNEAIKGFGGRDNRHYKDKLKSMIKVGACKHLCSPFEAYPHRRNEAHGRPVRGFLWIAEGKYIHDQTQVNDVYNKR